jgi:hypothetical protein
MKKKETKKLVKVMKAFVKGKTIEGRTLDGKLWRNCDSPRWDFIWCEYRIKGDS